MMNVNKTMKHLKDEYYTPFYLASAFFDAMTEQLYSMAMNKIALNEKLYIWCPFDTEHSSFVAAARKWAKERFGDTWEKVVCVEFSHIALGQDFFWYEPEHWDIAVSNPPFSLKLKIFNKLHKANKPLLQELAVRNDQHGLHVAQACSDSMANHNVILL
jgi:hypothetical protein